MNIEINFVDGLETVIPCMHCQILCNYQHYLLNIEAGILEPEISKATIVGWSN